MTGIGFSRRRGGFELPSSATHRWKVDEGSGTTWTDSIGSADATATFDTWVSGTYVGDTAPDFDGTDDEATTDTTIDVIDGTGHAIAVTVETSTSADVMLASLSGEEWYFRINGSTNSTPSPPNVVYRYGSTASEQVYSDGVTFDGTKLRILFNYGEGTNGVFYVNGSSITTNVNDNLASTDETGQTFYMGNWSSGGFEYPGILDDITLYDATLSSSEIQDDYDRQPWS